MVGGGLVVELEVLSGVTVLYVELPSVVMELDVAVGPEVLAEPEETNSEVIVVVVVAMIVVKLLEVVPEVVVKDSVAVVLEVAVATGLVDTDDGDTVVLAVGSGEDGPTVVVMVMADDPVGVVTVAVVVIGLPVSVTTVVL